MRLLFAVAAFTVATAQGTGAQDVAALVGVVLRDADGRAVEAAGVGIPQLGKATSTDTAGRFVIRGIKPGTHEILVRRVGYAPYRERISFARGQTIEDTIRLLAVNVLDSVVVRANAIASFDEHRALGLGSFLSREELANQEQRRLSDVISQMRGVQIVHGRANYAWLSSKRGPKSLSPRTCGVNRSSGGGGGLDLADAQMGAIPCLCYAQVYLDRALIYRGSQSASEPLFNLNSISVDLIEAIEYFAGPSQMPLEYSALNSGCGVLVIHTRRPR